jgi:hypothetical protein
MLGRVLATTVGVFYALSMVSCAERACPADWAPTVFSDFTYVGEFAADPSKPLPRHGETLRALPKQFKPGLAYVFHATGQLTTEDAALRLLPQRLRDAGIDIADAPKSLGEFAIPNSGGPRWSIRFRYDYCQGELHNVIDPALYGSRGSWPAGSRDDYVLVFHR